jgi:hypothetical protein
VVVAYVGTILAYAQVESKTTNYIRLAIWESNLGPAKPRARVLSTQLCEIKSEMKFIAFNYVYNV